MAVTIKLLIGVLFLVGVVLQGVNWACRYLFGGNTASAQVVNVFSALCWFAAVVLIVGKYALHWI